MEWKTVTILKDDAIEHRINYEIIVDTYDGEYAICWHIYLADTLNFPFTAKNTQSKLGAELTITGILDEEECEDGMSVYCLVKADPKDSNSETDELPINLEDLEVVSGDDATKQAVKDWCYWCAQGYELSNPDDPFEEEEDDYY